MAGEKPNPTIFISYSWNNSDVADEIDGYFSSVGMNLTRDVRDSKYRQSIKEFMKKIGECEFVLMLISKEFLESQYCMYEAMELFTDNNFEKRFLPIVLENAMCFSPEEKIEWINYWQCKYAHLKNQYNSLTDYSNIDSLGEDLKNYDNIKSNIGNFLKRISDMNAKTYDYHKRNNFKDILETIGFEDGNLIEELFQIVFSTEDDKKIISLEKILIKHPYHRNGLFYKAYLFSEIKEYETAVILWDNYLKDYKNDYDAWYNKGIAYTAFGQHDKAIECYDKAIEIKPDDHEAWCIKGAAHRKLNQNEKVIECYDKALVIKPDDHEAWYNKGNAYTALGQHDKAIESYDKALEIKPDKHEAWNNKGNALNKLRKYENALYCHNIALGINSDDADVWYNLACTYSLMNNKPEMLENLKKAIELDVTCKADAKKDKDFKAFWDDPDFKGLVE